MGEAKRKSPAPMPDADEVQKIANTLRTRFVVAGSRDVRRVRNPDVAMLRSYRVVGGDLTSCKDRKTVVFVHGYNVTTNEALRSAGDFFHAAPGGM